MLRAITRLNFSKPKPNINKLNFAIPLMAFTGFSVLVACLVNLEPDPSASAALGTSVSAKYEPYNAANYYIGIEGGDSVDIELFTASVENFAIGSDEVSVSTNLPSGYDLYLGMEGISNSLYLDGDNTKDAIVATSGQNSDGVLIPASLSGNSWGFAVADSSLGFDTDYSGGASGHLWSPVGVKGNETLIHASASAAVNDSTIVYYGVKVDGEMPAGTYSGTVVYSTLGESADEDLLVSPTSVDESTTTELRIITTLFTNTSISSDEITVTLTNESGAQYQCTEPVVSSSVNGYEGVVVINCVTPSLTAGVYSVNVSIPKFSYTKTRSDIISIKSQNSTPTSLQDGLDMQSATSSMCANTPLYSESGVTYTLKDVRDNNNYSIRKLDDGNCYMVDNLRITGNTLTANGHSTTLTSTDTDLGDMTSSDQSLTGGAFVMPSSASWTDTSTTGNHAISATEFSSSLTGIVRLANGSLVKETFAAGAYYSWCTATANCSRAANAGETMSTSICPKGWKIPQHNTDSTVVRSWKNLGYMYSSSSTFSDSLAYYSSAGYYKSGALNMMTVGTWWSSTKYSSSSAYDLWIRAEKTILEDDSSSVSYGFPVRCALWT